MPASASLAANAIGTVEGAEAHRAIATVMTAFAADPFVRYWFPEPHVFLERFPAGIRAFAGAAFDHGSAWTTDDYAGAALWLPPGVQPDGEAMVALARETFEPGRLSEFLDVAEQMEASHPAGPHWHLPLIGVDPAHQGRGIGSALLEQTLGRCDGDGIPAYLEATSPRNLPLYERFGFVQVGRIQAGGSPPLTPMLREPRPRPPGP